MDQDKLLQQPAVSALRYTVGRSNASVKGWGKLAIVSSKLPLIRCLNRIVAVRKAVLIGNAVSDKDLVDLIDRDRTPVLGEDSANSYRVLSVFHVLGSWNTEDPR